MIARFGPPLAIALLAGPVAAGLVGTLLPAFGFLPSLGHSTFSLEPFRALLAEPGLLRSLGVGVGAGLLSTALALGAVMLFVAGWIGEPVFQRLRRGLSPLLAVPHAAAAFGLAFLVAPSGFLARLVSPELTGWLTPPDVLIVNDPMGLTLAAGLAVKEAPFLFLMTLAALPQTPAGPSRQLAAALGYGRIAGFLHTVWPSLYRQIRLPVFAVIAFSTSVVDVAAILGPTAPPTLAVRLVQWMNDPDLAMRFKASAGAMLQLGATAPAILAWVGLERVGRVAARALCGSGFRFRRDGAPRLIGLAAMVSFAAVVFAGLAVLALWSVAGLWQFPNALPARFILSGWANTLPRLADPLLRSVGVGVAATAAALMLAVLSLTREDETGARPGQGARVLIYLPLLAPQIAFLFGLQTAILAAGLTPSTPLLVAVHLVFVLPYVFLSLADPWRAFDRRYEAVAFGLGRSRARMLVAVKLPMLAPALATAAAVGFAVSIGLYLPTVLIGAGRLPTVTTEAVALAAGGNRRIIGVWAFVQATLPAAGFVIAAMLSRLVYRGGAAGTGR
ncbi:MAG: ABC transporter permease [Phyllobacteriaceae bacterium]|nr:ABC transporter permease [Phyllobacteriaceae bacterium]